MKKENCCSQKIISVVDSSVECLNTQICYKKAEREAITSLHQTVQYMNSSDYIERFIAEYWQTKIRYEKLKKFCNRIEAAEYNKKLEAPKHDVPVYLLKDQQRLMGEYLHILEIRAVMENIDLSKGV